MSEPEKIADGKAAGTPPPAGRRPGKMRRWVVRPFVWGLAFLLLLVAGAYLLATSGLGRRRVADLVVARTSQFLGRPIRVGGLDYTFWPLAVELEDVVIPGPRPEDPPVATLPRVRIQSSWQDLRRKRLLLEEIAITKPRIYIQLNPDGTSNLPEFHTGGGGGQGRLEVRLGRILVEDGELRINERKLPLRVDARAVWGRLVGTADKNRLEALVTAQEVVVALPDARPYPMTLSARASLLVDQGTVRLTSVRAASPELKARAHGAVGWRGGAHMDLTAEGEGAAALLNRLGYLEPAIDGSFRYRLSFLFGSERTGGPWSFDGEIASPRVALLGRVFEDVAARFDGRPERLLVDVERTRYAGGKVAGQIRVAMGESQGEAAAEAGRAAGTPIDLDLTLRDLAIETLLADQQVPVAGLSGRATGTVRYSFRSDAPLAGSGRADVVLAARTAQTRGLALSGRLPVVARDGVLTSDAIVLTAPGQKVSGSGRIDLEPFQGQLDLQLDSRDLGPLAALVPVEGAEPPPWLPTGGHGRAGATLRFAPAVSSADVFAADITLDLADVAAPALALDRAEGSFRYTPAAITELALTARRGEGTLSVAGRIPLPEDGRVAPSQGLRLDLRLASWPAGSLAGLLPGAPPLAGEISGTADVGGTFESLTGRAELRGTSLAIDGNTWGEIEATVAFAGPRIRLDELAVSTPAGDLLAEGFYDRASGALQGTLDAAGLALDREPLARYLAGFAGEASLAATVEGTLDRPRATLTLRGDDLSFQGRRLGEAGETSLLASWDGATVSVAGSALGLLSFDGGGRLDRQGAEVAFSLGSDSLAGLAQLAVAEPLPEFSGSLTGTLAVSSDFAAGTLRSELTLDRLAARLAGREIANQQPVSIVLTPEQLQIRSFYLGEPEHNTELVVNGTVSLGDPAQLDLRVLSTIWVGWLQLALPDYGFAGFVDALATVRGTLDAPVLNGEAVLRDARVILPDLPFALEDMTGFLYFDRSTVRFDGVRAKIGGGTLQVAGSLEIPSADSPLRYQVQAIARDLSLRYPEGWLIRGGGQLALTGTAEARQIRGQVELERAFYLEDVEVGTFQLLQQVLRRERLEVASTDDALAATELFIQVDGPDALRVRNNVASVAGDIDLLVRGTAARPVVFGRVELTPGGKLTYADNEYAVERGLLTFENPYRIDPVIDLVASTEVQSYEITLNLSGTLDRLNTSFSSNTDLADLEILSLIATGTRFENERDLLEPGERQGSGLGAEGFLAGQAASLVSKRVSTLFGFDRFRINPIASETGQSIGGVGVTVGKRLSRDVFVTYSTNPSSTRQNVLQVEWKVASNLTLLLTQATDGYAVDAQWEKRF